MGQRSNLLSYHRIIQTTPAGLEPVLPERQSGVLTTILWSFILCGPANSGPLSFVSVSAALAYDLVHDHDVIQLYAQYGG